MRIAGWLCGSVPCRDLERPVLHGFALIREGTRGCARVRLGVRAEAPQHVQRRFEDLLSTVSDAVLTPKSV